MAQTSALQALMQRLSFYGRFAPSFTRIGYVARGLPFKPVRADYSGQTWMVSGATGGLGEAITLRAAAKGATVLAIGRNENALDRLASRPEGQGRIVPVVCDLSSMRDVAALSQRPEIATTRLDVLINNVGVLMNAYETTAEGLETSYATNLLGHWVLTEDLHRAGLFKPDAAIINVVSGGLYTVGLTTKLLNMPEPRFSGATAYAAHKRAQIALTDHWRTAWAGDRIRTYAVHPGWADTPGVKTSLPEFRKALAAVLRNAHQGTDTMDWLAATRPTEVGDAIWFDRKSRTAHAFPQTRNTKATIADVVTFLNADRQRLGV